MIPLILKLKRTTHKEVAKAQDTIIEELYRIFDRAVLHGGTAIWRCYGSNRFSEDVDVYLPFESNAITDFFEKLTKVGFIVLKKRVSKKSIFSSLRFGRAIVRFEVVFKKVEGFLSEYETVDGNIISIYALKPEELIKEKVNAYINRYKVRDLYDIFFLLRHVKDKASVKKDLQRLVNSYRKPVDDQDLKVLIIEGLMPSAEKMLDYIKYRL